MGGAKQSNQGPFERTPKAKARSPGTGRLGWELTISPCTCLPKCGPWFSEKGIATHPPRTQWPRSNPSISPLTKLLKISTYPPRLRSVCNEAEDQDFDSTWTTRFGEENTQCPRGATAPHIVFSVKLCLGGVQSEWCLLWLLLSLCRLSANWRHHVPLIKRESTVIEAKHEEWLGADIFASCHRI